VLHGEGTGHSESRGGGFGQSQLDDELLAAAKAKGRSVTPDAHPEKGLAFRADHFSLAKKGVPALLLMGLGGGPDLVSGGRAAGDKWVNDYTANCYHKACDAWSPDWDLRGAAADVEGKLTRSERRAHKVSPAAWQK
jgi:Zn-dependent M28 family amino/carboxypeptidase